MRPVPEALAAHLAGAATTLCRCWRLVRRDGAVLGFTDHDRDLAFDGTTFRARTGLEAAEATQELGFAVGGGEVAGAFACAGIREEDLAAGLYDAAAAECWLVSWGDPEARMLLGTFAVGEVRRADGAFTAELRGPMHRLDEERGRVFAAACDAELGDARCGVDLSAPAHRAEGTASAASEGTAFRAAGLEGRPDGAFSGGILRWTAGANAGAAGAVREHRGAVVDLWDRPARPVAAGDAFTLRAGCDRSFATCRDRFRNAAAFRGFPHMPGASFVLQVARPGNPS